MGHELEKVMELAEPLAASMGFEIIKTESVADHGQKILRIYLDSLESEKGITIEDCEKFSRALGTILDVEGGIQGRYHLEISSPGLNRPLAKARHFAAQIGKIIDLTTEEPIEDRRNYKGELLKMIEDRVLVVEVDGHPYEIPLDQVKRAHLDYFASEEKERQSHKGFKKKH